MHRPPDRDPRRLASPGEVFVLFVTWCALGITAFIGTILLWPWFLPSGSVRA